MGLPHLSSADDTYEDPSTLLGSFLQSPPGFDGVSCCDLDGLHGGDVSRTVGHSQSSSLGDFQMKTAFNRSRFPENSLRFGGAVDATSNVNQLMTGSIDNIGRITPKIGKNIQDPASRIIGFESRGASPLDNGFERFSVDHLHSSSVSSLTVNQELVGPLVRKRLLSPLKSMLSAEKFDGDNLDIGCHASQLSSSSLTNNLNMFAAVDYKKANFGSKINFTASAWSLSSCLDKSGMLCNNSTTASVLLTDGPLLENKDSHTNSTFLYSPTHDHFKESSEGRYRNWAISLSPRKAISPLSLSPLGPKCSERIKTPGRCKDVKSPMGDCRSNLEKIGQSLDKHNSDIIFAPEEADFGITSRSFEDIGIFRREFSPPSPEGAADSWSLFQEPAPSQSTRFIRSLSGLPVRRSLVGSFEESLLSGRFFSGKFTQVNSDVIIVTAV